MVKNTTALFCFIVLGLLLTALIVPAVVADPYFSGDAAHRMHMAQYPAIRMDNRVWLPMLQVHIWLLYQIQAPLFVYKLVPCFYYFAATVLVGLLAFHNTRRTREGLMFSLLLAFFFARNGMVLSLGISLMQEIIDLALFFFLLQTGALELRKRWWVFLAAVFALLTRDTFWIYLFVVSLLNWRKLLGDRASLYTFVALYAVPALWLMMIPVGYWLVDGRLPDFPTEWPLGINKEENQAVTSLPLSLASLWTSLTTTGVVYLVAALPVVWAVVHSTKAKRPSPSDSLSATFVPFSLVSLAIVYTLVILFDPFQATPGARRMSLPLLAQGYVWAIIVFGEATVCYRTLRYAAVLLIFVALGASSRMDPLLLPVHDFTEVKQVHRQIEDDLDQMVPQLDDRICIMDENYFVALARLLPPTFYRDRVMVLQTPKPSLAACKAVFAPSGTYDLAREGFLSFKDYNLDYGVDGISYTLFLRRQGS